MSRPSILISGSGIAGTVFAYWLLRAYRNVNITIVERAPTPRLTGASVDIRSSAIDIIKMMDMEEEIRKHGTKEQGISYVDRNGKAIATLGATGRTDVQSITSEYEIFRGELAQIFISPVRERVEFIFDDYVDNFEQHENAVTVTFAKTKETRRFDLLVVADGFGSRLRGQMLNNNPRNQIHDEGVHVAYFTIKNDLLNGSRLAKWYNSTGGRVVFLRPDPNPAGRTRGNLMNVTWKNDIETKKRLNDAVDAGPESYMTLMEELFRDAGWIASEVLEAMRQSDDFYCSLFAQVRSPKLHDRRVVLLGDAGYATPGIGTSLAIIGAYTLAGELLRNPNDMPSACNQYQEIMAPFVKGHQGDDVAMQLLNPQSQRGIRIRNATLKVVTGLKLDKLAMYGAAKLGFTEKKLKMPDYQWLDI